MGWKLQDQCELKDCDKKATHTLPYKGKQIQMCAQCYEIIVRRLQQEALKNPAKFAKT